MVIHLFEDIEVLSISEETLDIDEIIVFFELTRFIASHKLL